MTTCASCGLPIADGEERYRFSQLQELGGYAAARAAYREEVA